MKVAPPKKYGGNIMTFFKSNATPMEEQRGVGIDSNAPLQHPTAKKQPKQAPTPAPGPASSSNPITEEMQETIAANAAKAADWKTRGKKLEEALTTARREAAEKIAAGGSLDPKLNQEQRNAVEAPIDLPLMIVAGAGTGKTRTIICRVLHMVLLNKVHPASILLFSFTVKAAKEAQHRLDELGCPGSDLIRVATFHSYCFSVLGNYFSYAGFEKCPVVVSEKKDLRRIMSIVEVRCRVERYKEELCTWLELPFLTSTWQNVVDEMQNCYPGLFHKAAETAAEWFKKNGVTKPKKKTKAAVAALKKQPVAQKRKAAAGNSGASASTQVCSPTKQLRLNFGSAPVPTAFTQEEEVAEAADALALALEEQEQDCFTLALAGTLDKMPRELQTALFAHLYDSLYLREKPEAYRQELAMVNKLKKKNLITSLAVTFLAPKSVKEINKHLEELESLKSRGIDFETIIVPDQQRLYKAYQEELTAQNAVDFNDLLLKVRDMLKTHPHVAQSLQRRHPYVIIDEFQDTNAVQLEILNAIAPAGSSPSLTVVGDGDQLIYVFRGAEPLVMHLIKILHYHEGSRKRLELNYRCTHQVLDVAAAALDGNRDRDPMERLVPTKTTSQEKAIVRQCCTYFSKIYIILYSYFLLLKRFGDYHNIII
jgi:superfamily I DNA/RNA helicase